MYDGPLIEKPIEKTVFAKGEKRPEFQTSGFFSRSPSKDEVMADAGRGYLESLRASQSPKDNWDTFRGRVTRNRRIGDELFWTINGSHRYNYNEELIERIRPTLNVENLSLKNVKFNGKEIDGVRLGAILNQLESIYGVEEFNPSVIETMFGLLVSEDNKGLEAYKRVCLKHYIKALERYGDQFTRLTYKDLSYVYQNTDLDRIFTLNQDLNNLLREAPELFNYKNKKDRQLVLLHKYFDRVYRYLEAISTNSDENEIIRYRKSLFHLEIELEEEGLDVSKQPGSVPLDQRENYYADIRRRGISEEHGFGDFYKGIVQFPVDNIKDVSLFLDSVIKGDIASANMLQVKNIVERSSLLQLRTIWGKLYSAVCNYNELVEGYISGALEKSVFEELEFELLNDIIKISFSICAADNGGFDEVVYLADCIRAYAIKRRYRLYLYEKELLESFNIIGEDSLLLSIPNAERPEGWTKDDEEKANKGDAYIVNLRKRFDNMQGINGQELTDVTKLEEYKYYKEDLDSIGLFNKCIVNGSFLDQTYENGMSEEEKIRLNNKFNDLVNQKNLYVIFKGNKKDISKIELARLMGNMKFFSCATSSSLDNICDKLFQHDVEGLYLLKNLYYRVYLECIKLCGNLFSNLSFEDLQYVCEKKVILAKCFICLQDISILTLCCPYIFDLNKKEDRILLLLDSYFNIINYLIRKKDEKFRKSLLIMEEEMRKEGLDVNKQEVSIPDEEIENYKARCIRNGRTDSVRFKNIDTNGSYEEIKKVMDENIEEIKAIENVSGDWCKFIHCCDEYNKFLGKTNEEDINKEAESKRENIYLINILNCENKYLRITDVSPYYTVRYYAEARLNEVGQRGGLTEQELEDATKVLEGDAWLERKKRYFNSMIGIKYENLTTNYEETDHYKDKISDGYDEETASMMVLCCSDYLNEYGASYKNNRRAISDLRETLENEKLIESEDIEFKKEDGTLCKISGLNKARIMPNLVYYKCISNTQNVNIICTAFRQLKAKDIQGVMSLKNINHQIQLECIELCGNLFSNLSIEDLRSLIKHNMILSKCFISIQDWTQLIQRAPFIFDMKNREDRLFVLMTDYFFQVSYMLQYKNESLRKSLLVIENEMRKEGVDVNKQEVSLPEEEKENYKARLEQNGRNDSVLFYNIKANGSYEEIKNVMAENIDEIKGISNKTGDWGSFIACCDAYNEFLSNPEEQTLDKDALKGDEMYYINNILACECKYKIGPREIRLFYMVEHYLTARKKFLNDNDSDYPVVS